jgi:hypothetical protein
MDDDRLNPVGRTIAELYPNCEFMVVVWKPGAKLTVVDMVTNLELGKIAGMLKKTSDDVKRGVKISLRDERLRKKQLRAVLSGHFEGNA